ncbi:hypothetical protein JZ751_008304 [Albula glossodonta]|uniref:Rad21/Rec8-like protein N-terminal domain-containing protein n=1 Tax=Albula glossodonta TaxID=121402 RepID=A0A8T2N9G5_9TELE|nr:hypothetical protein JZ751_008304 [Albula glossodonta]
MFYYPNVLQHRTGCFSTICNDIMDYVLVRVAPLQPGLPRPRFSLYLSAQLQYGVVIIYHRQCAILLEDIQHTIDRLLRSMKQLKIDLVESDRPILIPDCLSAMEESEWAQDPFFGVMGLPSPSTFIQRWKLAEEVSPPRPLVRIPETPPKDGISASPELITLPEMEPAASPAPEFEGVELPEVTARHIEMLMEQEDQFPAGWESQQWPVRTWCCCQRRREGCPRRRRPRQLLFIDVQTQIPQEELRRAIQDPLTETHPLVLIEAPSRRTVPPAELLSNPCTFLPPDILALWEQGAVITPLERAPASRRETEEEMEGEPEREIEAVAKEEEVKEKEEGEEVHRELVETGLPRPEVMVLEPLEEQGMVSFHSLLPPLVDRITVACYFNKLLGPVVPPDGPVPPVPAPPVFTTRPWVDLRAKPRRVSPSPCLQFPPLLTLSLSLPLLVIL